MNNVRRHLREDDEILKGENGDGRKINVYMMT